MKFNFDVTANRRNSNCCKWDCGQEELPMWIADMDFESPKEIKETIINKAQIGAFGYTFVPDEYFNAYHNWFLKKHHVDIDTSWMIYSSGVVACLSSIVRKLTTPNENVLIMAPSYNCFYSSIRNNGRIALESNLVYENNQYHIDWLDLENKIKDPQTSMMILCNPHNPSGTIWTEEEIKKILKLTKENGVILVSDEVHADFTDPGLDYNPMANYVKDYDHVIICLSGGKTFNIAGMQSACIVVKDEILRHKVWRGINTDEVGEPNFFAVEANIAGFNNCLDWEIENNQYIYDNKQYLTKYINDNLKDLSVCIGHSTYLLWVNIEKLGIDSKEFCDGLRKNTGLWLANGLTYGESGKYFFRINLATSRKNVEDAANRLNNYVNLLKGEK